MNTKALVALILLITLGVSTGVYAYSNLAPVQDSNVHICNSNVTITDSNVTITNSTITLGEGNTIILPSQTSTPIINETVSSTKSSSATAPKITSVSPISAAQSQTIIIQGNGFGNIQPQLMSLGDGSVDTVWGSSTPSIVVYDENNLLSAGAAGDWPGFTNGPPDLIGIVLVSWTNTQIVLGGFGSGLGSQFSWSQVAKGDTLQIQIQTAGGTATFDIVAT
jgi:hypothetical protein